MVAGADLPLFPLPLVALPGELVPLHVFEERYKAMVAHCLEHESEFGIVWAADDGLRPIGCACAIAEILERFPDGRVNLVARGTRPFRIERRREDRPFPTASVEFLDDAPEPGHEELAAEVRRVYGQLVEKATDRPADAGAVAAMGAYEMAATVDFGLDAKQGLLDLRSERARLQLCLRLFRAALKRLSFADRVAERARSNGKVRF